ncbi:MAG: MotA/TolQ/ExbB proton channel family protein [Deltaproteobacteria bacterium]|nr:MotA/TolQ/ExbB proton channel family protein [Deltaproteobacteria bacterium]
MKGVPPPGSGGSVALDPLSLAKNSSGIVFAVLAMLVLAAVAVWFIMVLKLLQLRRWAKAQARFEEDAARAENASALFEMAKHHADAPGARVVLALHARRAIPAVLEGVAKRALVEEQKGASSMMSALGSIGSAGPFVGLFGTVWGIMDAFLRIGREKSASLPVVAPAIGEALIATAVGLFAAIPAVIGYNAISKRVDDLLGEVEAAAQGWVAQIAAEAAKSVGSLAEPTPALPTPPGLSTSLPVPIATPALRPGLTPPPPSTRPGVPPPTPAPSSVVPMPTPRVPEAELSGALPLNQLRPPGPPFPGR